MVAINGTTNGYPQGQCTYYADSRYHELTGYYVPWSGNAKDWADQALAYGWTVSSKPVVPSIICLQAGVQGADATYGHVGVVESIGKGTVVASNQNWGPYPANVTDVTFTAPAAGVSFIYAGSGSSPAGSSNTSLSDAVSTILQGNSKVSVTPNSDVTDFLWYLDQIMAVTNPFTATASTDSISVLGQTLSFTDPVAWAEQVLGNIFDDFIAITIRSVFLVIGVVLILKVLSQYIDMGNITTIVESLGAFA